MPGRMRGLRDEAPQPRLPLRAFFKCMSINTRPERGVIKLEYLFAAAAGKWMIVMAHAETVPA